ncbi:MAG: carbohydrate ABC transporter permease [Candidatus Phytoplasma stylosanthis]|nr:carbohydrate ABC transporter permease [Candidatus Phytoplasma stylosanthis]MDV3167811.1 carbohydrate ABC transporter permease [Candidatus Phytoplasma stylosanthis]MDV3202396.1 carbohydrate ABC transporter permease [Candidatus Phytoplasma stylosanthis]
MISIKSFSDIIQNNYLSLPKNGWHWENYKLALQQMEFIKFFLNTLRVTFFSTLLGTLCSILTAYALSILDLKFKPILLMFLLLGLMTTSETLVITNYRTISNAGLVDYGQGPKVPFGTDYAVILPYLVNIVHILLLVNVFKNTPKELYYTAKIDGTSDWQYLWKILVPIAKPTIIVTVIFRIVGCWNAYAWPNLVGAQLLTNMARKVFDIETEIDKINLQMANLILINIPLFLIFIFFKKYIISGEAKSGIKG